MVQLTITDAPHLYLSASTIFLSPLPPPLNHATASLYTVPCHVATTPSHPPFSVSLRSVILSKSASDADSPSSLLHQRFPPLFSPLMNFPLAFNFLTEFGCGFVLLASLSRLLNFLGMVLMFGFCFKILRFGWRFKGSIRFLCDFGGIPRIHFCLQNVVWEVSNPKTAPLEKGRDPNANSSTKKSPNVAGEKVHANSEDGLDGRDDSERELRDEDEVFDVTTLRKLVKTERKKANAACAELEKERTAAASSAEEAMAMILRLQSEKSSAEIQANQFRRMAEQKLDYDQEVIESLQWTITQHESQRSELEEQLGAYREELKQYLGEDEINQLEIEVSRGRSFENEPDDFVVSSSETESQTL